jgi:hypothetical protein
MLEAMLEPADACASSAECGSIATAERAMGVPDAHVLSALRGIPEIECLLGGAVASWHSSLGSLHSRRWHRVAYDKPLLITPLDDVTERPAANAFLVQGRDLSLSGVSFCHPLPLASRKVIVHFHGDDASATEDLLAMLRWCRFRRDGSYQSGGQFLRCVPLPSDSSWPQIECSGLPLAARECSRAF